MFNKCEYIISAVSKNQFPHRQGINEYIFLGRSNVGKSSLINALTNRKLLAHTSTKPGKTQTINFYLIDDKFYFVDAPGYGYASKSLTQRLSFGKYLEDYLQNNPYLKIVFLLIDTKVGPTADDVLMFEYLKYLNLKIIIIATKADKVGTTHIQRHIKQIKEKLNFDQIIITSSVKKYGIDKIIELID